MPRQFIFVQIMSNESESQITDNNLIINNDNDKFLLSYLILKEFLPFVQFEEIQIFIIK